MATQKKQTAATKRTGYFVTPSQLVGRKARIYLNLHKPGLLSVQSIDGEDKGLVISHVRSIEMTGCSFVVSEAGRQRVLRDKAKNVHAWICGTIISATSKEDNQEEILFRLDRTFWRREKKFWSKDNEKAKEYARYSF